VGSDNILIRENNEDMLIQHLGKAVLKLTNHSTGHIHIYFNGFRDHIILFYTNGKLDKICAKSPESKKGTHTAWKQSQFADYGRAAALMKFRSQIKRIEFDDGNYKTWSSYEDLAEWSQNCK